MTPQADDHSRHDQPVFPRTRTAHTDLPAIIHRASSERTPFEKMSGIRTTALHDLAGMVTASRCCPEVSAPQPQPPRTSPDDLAAELNPHKTELNPHKAVEAASRARTLQTGLRSSGQSPPATAASKGAAVRPPAIRCAHDAPLPPRAELAHAWPSFGAHPLAFMMPSRGVRDRTLRAGAALRTVARRPSEPQS
jgi:hypothetical protein